MDLAPRILVTRILAALLLMACDRHSSSPMSGIDPSPAASVVSIAAALGECEDMEACQRECDAGKSDRCRRMGVNYEFGKRVDRDEARATELYAHACDMGNPEGCLAAGRMYEFHHGVAKDDVRAATLYRRSCDLDDPTGCANLAIMLENGRGVDKDERRAAELYEGACRKGAGLACERAKALGASMDGGLR
jgi:TPR repeat protein